jgi:hypothetical protein
MRNTKNLPDDPPPLVERAPTSSFGSVTGGFPGVAAKLSLCAGLFSFLLGHNAVTAKVRLSAGAMQGVFLVCILLIVAGLLLAAWALIANRTRKRSGVTGFAVAGLLVNGLLVALHAYSFISARGAGS